MNFLTTKICFDPHKGLFQSERRWFQKFWKITSLFSNRGICPPALESVQFDVEQLTPCTQRDLVQVKVTKDCSVYQVNVES